MLRSVSRLPSTAALLTPTVRSVYTPVLGAATRASSSWRPIFPSTSLARQLIPSTLCSAAPSRLCRAQPLRSMSSTSTSTNGDGGVFEALVNGDQKASTKGSIASSKDDFPPCLQRPTASNSVFFVCDIQETFRDKMLQWPLLVSASVFLTRLANQLDIPILVTEQKPFKPTIDELALDSIPHTLYPKTLFSMLTPSLRIDLRENYPQRRHVYLYGIEAHVCVLQTALDLLREGYTVHLPLDAVTSMHAVDREGALERFRALAREGAVLTSAESVAFEFVGDASKADFKKIVPFIKEHATTKKRLATGGAETPSKL